MLHVGDVPAIDPARWKLRFFGLVENPFEIGFDELRAMPPAGWRGDIHCVTRWSKKDTSWTGVPLRALLERARPAASVSHVVQHAHTGYTTNLPLREVLGDDALVAYEFDGRPIEPLHGGPVRMLVPKKYFWKSAKWLHGIELLDRDAPGFWEIRGYHNEGDPWKEERYDLGA